MVSNASSLNPPHFTVAAWIKTSRHDRTWRRVVDKGYADGFALSVGGVVGTDTNYQGKAVLEIALGANKTAGIIKSDHQVNDGDWHHLAATYDGLDQRLYVNGVLQSQTARWRGRLPENSRDLTIGINLADPDPALDEVGASFDGLIDEVMLFNRALSAEEITFLVNSIE